MTLRATPDMKGIPLERVSVRADQREDHATDCAIAKPGKGKIDRIERFHPPRRRARPAQRQKLLEIANKCPVHRTLQSEVVIPTALPTRTRIPAVWELDLLGGWIRGRRAALRCGKRPKRATIS